MNEYKVMMRIHQGTVRNDVDLCRSCRWAVIRRDGRGIEQRACSAVNMLSPLATLSERIADCNSYLNASLPTVDEFKEIAWELTPPSQGGKIGFITPEDRRKAGIGFGQPTPPGFRR